jgi:hypothetical protein
MLGGAWYELKSRENPNLYPVTMSSYLNKEVTVRFGKLKMQLWDSMC